MGPTTGLDAVAKKKKIPAPDGNRIPVVQAVAYSLNLLSYLGSSLVAIESGSRKKVEGT
jgi:hypothetical protein